MKNPFRHMFRPREPTQADNEPSRAENAPTQVENAVSNATVFYMGSSSAGQAVSERTAMQLTAVYACVRIIAETVASLPLNLYRRDGALVEKATGHSLDFLLHNEPNDEMTSFVFRETLMTQLLLWGNAYAQILRDRRGQVLALYPLLPGNMRADRTKNGTLYYEYLKDGQIVLMRADQVLHIPGLGFDGIVGHSPIAVAKNALGSAIATEDFGAKFFKNGAIPSGILTTDKKIQDREALRKAWQEGYGNSNTLRTAILEEGMKYERVSIPNSDAQFLETRKFQVSEICRLFRVPPHMVGDLERATFSNIEHQSIEFTVHTIRPWVKRIEQGMDRQLLLPSEKREYFVGFNIDGLLRGDYKSRMEGYAVGRQNGWLSANDIRAMENMNPIPAEEGGNLYHMNGSMIPLTGASGEGGDGDVLDVGNQRGR